MTTQNSVNTTLAGQTGTGAFVGSIGATFTTPKISQVFDTNGNVVLGTVAATTAVNYLSVGNSATGNPVFIQATGSDTNIGIQYVAKGTGTPSFYTTAVNGQLIFLTGAGYQHTTQFNLPSAATTQVITVPDITGTMYLASKANGTEAANAVTASGNAGTITTSSLTTAGGANYAITWTNTFIVSTSQVLLTIAGGTNTTQNITLKCVPGSGTATLTIYNNTVATALNGTILISYAVI